MLRKRLIALGWKPVPSEMKAILIESGKLYTNGTRFLTEEPYGNCLVKDSPCDPSKPEWAHCDEVEGCTGVWGKNDETIWYIVRDGMIVQSGSSSKNKSK